MKIEKLRDYSLNTDKKTIEQIKSCIKYDFVLDAALMPDAHSGYVAPIGSVIVTKNYIVPSWVGYDIGCGVLVIKLTSKNLLSKVKNNSKYIFKKINQAVPLSKGVYNEITNLSRNTKKKYLELIEEYKNKLSKDDLNFFKQRSTLLNLGSLGSGNHFIEIGYSSNKKRNDEIWLIIHSGSRSIGHHIAEKYMKLAKKLNTLNIKENNNNKNNNKDNFEETFPVDISTREGNHYFNAQNFCIHFAKLNRLEIAYKIYEELEKLFNIKIEIEIWSNSSHNYLINIKELKSFNKQNLDKLKINFDKDKIFIHRKGATSARKDERGVIPGNMKDGSYLVIGLGNKDYLESSSHGAGRVLSRKDTKERIKIEEYKEAMKGIIANVNEKNIDESPFAYKNIHEVLEKQNKSIKVIEHIVPLINWKG